MRIFISYAKEDSDLADRLAFSLRSSGHAVFVDKDDLPPGQSHDERIRKAIRSSGLFIFIATNNSIREGRYTLTEVKIARQKWRTPHKRVVTVIPSKMDETELPSFLKGATFLKIHGDTVAETSLFVEMHYGRPSLVDAAIYMLPLGIIVGLLASVVRWWNIPLVDLGNSNHVTAGLAIRGVLLACIVGFAVWKWNGKSVFQYVASVCIAAVIGSLPAFNFFAQLIDKGGPVPKESGWVTVPPLSMALAFGADSVVLGLAAFLGTGLFVNRLLRLDVLALLIGASGGVSLILAAMQINLISGIVLHQTLIFVAISAVLAQSISRPIE